MKSAIRAILISSVVCLMPASVLARVECDIAFALLRDNFADNTRNYALESDNLRLMTWAMLHDGSCLSHVYSGKHEEDLCGWVAGTVDGEPQPVRPPSNETLKALMRSQPTDATIACPNLRKESERVLGRVVI
jgi:hypothetical protein